jgi:hypothetical protein
MEVARREMEVGMKDFAQGKKKAIEAERGGKNRQEGHFARNRTNPPPRNRVFRP